MLEELQIMIADRLPERFRGWPVRFSRNATSPARTAEVGDETGSAVTAARLARDMMMMRLALMLQRRYAPYQKWLGTAFARAQHGDSLPERLTQAVHADDVTARESALAEAYTALARRHNDAALTTPVEASMGDYYTRPARVLMAGRFTDACLATVTAPMLREPPLTGAIDQVVDSTDALEYQKSDHQSKAGLEVLNPQRVADETH